MEPKIFLCHASEDKDRVQQIYLEMRAAGLSPWMDKPPSPYELDGILPGEDWDRRIRREIRGSAYCIALLSKKSVNKRSYVQREFRLALTMAAEMPPGQVYLIPALLEHCEVPDLAVDSVSLSSLQWIELDGTATKLIRILERDRRNRQDLLAEGHKTFDVRTSEELFRAVGSNRTLRLAPGDYVLDRVSAPYARYIELDPVHDGAQLVFRDLENLTLSGEQGEVRILANSQYADVLQFRDSNNLLRLSGITFGHWPERAFCSGDVLAFVRCRPMRTLWVWRHGNYVIRG